MRSPRRVVVTGYGVVTPLGPDLETTFAAATAGRSGITEITRFDARGLPCRIAGQVDDAWLAPAEVTEPWRTSRGARLALHAAAEAVAAAHLAAAELREAAVVLGTHGDNPTLAEAAWLQQRWRPGSGFDLAALAADPGYDARQFLRRKPDVAAAVLAAAHGCHGPTLAVASACAAGAQALGEAARMVADGVVERALAGGADAAVDPVGVLGFTLLRALSERHASPATASRPFERRRNGFVIAEGAGVVVLEELGAARQRGVAILGEVLGYGDSADAYRITDALPGGEGAALAMRRALEDAGLPPAAVEVVNAHATATVVGDLAEARALEAVLGPDLPRVGVTANKSMLGHTIGAAGAIEAVLALEGMRRGLVLPTINLERLDPRIGLRVVTETLARPHRVVLSNSFGFGGQNACLCLGRWDERAS